MNKHLLENDMNPNDFFDPVSDPFEWNDMKRCTPESLETADTVLRFAILVMTGELWQEADIVGKAALRSDSTAACVPFQVIEAVFGVQDPKAVVDRLMNVTYEPEFAITDVFERRHVFSELIYGKESRDGLMPMLAFDPEFLRILDDEFHSELFYDVAEQAFGSETLAREACCLAGMEILIRSLVCRDLMAGSGLRISDRVKDQVMPLRAEFDSGFETLKAKLALHELPEEVKNGSRVQPIPHLLQSAVLWRDSYDDEDEDLSPIYDDVQIADDSDEDDEEDADDPIRLRLNSDSRPMRFLILLMAGYVRRIQAVREDDDEEDWKDIRVYGRESNRSGLPYQTVDACCQPQDWDALREELEHLRFIEYDPKERVRREYHVFDRIIPISYMAVRRPDAPCQAVWEFSQRYLDSCVKRRDRELLTDVLNDIFWGNPEELAAALAAGAFETFWNDSDFRPDPADDLYAERMTALISFFKFWRTDQDRRDLKHPWTAFPWMEEARAENFRPGLEAGLSVCDFAESVNERLDWIKRTRGDLGIAMACSGMGVKGVEQLLRLLLPCEMACENLPAESGCVGE